MPAQMRSNASSFYYTKLTLLLISLEIIIKKYKKNYKDNILMPLSLPKEIHCYGNIKHSHLNAVDIIENNKRKLVYLKQSWQM